MLSTRGAGAFLSLLARFQEKNLEMEEELEDGKGGRPWLTVLGELLLRDFFFPTLVSIKLML